MHSSLCGFGARHPPFVAGGLASPPSPGAASETSNAGRAKVTLGLWRRQHARTWSRNRLRLTTCQALCWPAEAVPAARDVNVCCPRRIHIAPILGLVYWLNKSTPYRKCMAEIGLPKHRCQTVTTEQFSADWTTHWLCTPFRFGVLRSRFTPRRMGKTLLGSADVAPIGSPPRALTLALTKCG